MPNPSRSEERIADSSIEEAESPSTLAHLAPPMTLERSGTAGAVVYATAAGALSAIPVPFLDGALAGIARGSAVRRVASRRGVRISREARDVLSKVGMTRHVATGPARLLRMALSRALAPVRIASRLEDASASFFTVVLLDHYLRTGDRRHGAPLGGLEAERVRAAMEDAIARGGIDALRSVPLGLVQLVYRAGRAAIEVDAEDRGPIERFVDTLLDGLADAPASTNERLTEHFDAAIARGTGHDPG